MNRQTLHSEHKKSDVTLRIGVDTGGTFTDFVAVAGQRILSFKVPSTPQAPAQAILAGIERILNDAELISKSPQLSIVHGTTVATNALLERKGARTALITTAGFEDVIEIGRQARPDLYNLAGTRPAPLVPRALRFGLRERVAADGSVIEKPDPEQVQKLAVTLSRARVESVAISLLFSFARPEHEQEMAEAITRLGLPVSVSHRILPEYREYERTSTVVINAYLAPRVGQYLRELVAGLSATSASNSSRSQQALLRVMQSSGGSISAEVAAREPVRTILSGPAGGVVAATEIARLTGDTEVMTFDMGGTSTDVALWQGAAQTTSEAQITGLPVAVPVLDIHTVGAGGGSIAFVDPGGALRVGPESAGADPGPACYGKGTRPTVTDANLVLGRFGHAGLLGGQMPLDETRAAAALDELAGQMSAASARRVSRDEAALGVIRVVNANMEQALRLVSVERGHDPRRFTLVSFGGAGGLHAVALAAALRLPKVIIPENPGAFSALGVLLADVVRDYSRTVMLKFSGPEQKALSEIVRRHFAELERQAVSEMRAEGFSGSRLRLTRSLALRYAGQSFELDAPCANELNARVAASFHRAHQERYGHSDPQGTIEIVSLRLRATGLSDKPPLHRTKSFRTHQARPQSSTLVRITKRPESIPVYDRQQLRPGARFSGPALIGEYGSTTLLPGGWNAAVDAWRNLILTPVR
ncbi:MAG: hydantoinase/oxoprolinase family protein [Blastocatellia bacterium]